MINSDTYINLSKGLSSDPYLFDLLNQGQSNLGVRTGGEAEGFPVLVLKGLAIMPPTQLDGRFVTLVVNLHLEVRELIFEDTVLKHLSDWHQDVRSFGELPHQGYLSSGLQL